MVGEEIRHHVRYLVKERVVRGCARSGIDEHNQVVGSHLLGEHEYFFPVIHFPVSGTQELAFASAEGLQDTLGLFVGIEDDACSDLAAQASNQAEA
jgi:hypothetical protein